MTFSLHQGVVFNNYFSNVASNLDRNIPHSNKSPLNFLRAPVENSFFCAPSDREEIVNLIRRQNKSTDLMNIPVFIYKILASIISPTVSMLFNNSVSEGILVFSYFHVAFLVKNIWEIDARLDSYLKSNNILCANQFGFRKNSNTSDAIIELIDYVYSSLDSKQSTIAVYLDFSKKFDTVNHNILMSKHLHNGVGSVMQHWFESYLNNRKQYVSIKNCNSYMSNITFGVPQG